MKFNKGDIVVLSDVGGSPWGGAKAVITKADSMEEPITALLWGRDAYTFEILDKSLPRFDADDDSEMNPDHAWLGLAFDDEMTLDTPAPKGVD